MDKTNNIKIYRNRLGLTQKNLAEYLGVTTSIIKSIENGKSDPNLFQTKKLADLFFTDEHDLIVKEKTPKKYPEISRVFKNKKVNRIDMGSISRFFKIVKNYINLKNTIK